MKYTAPATATPKSCPVVRAVASVPPAAFAALVDPGTGLVSGTNLQPAWSGSLRSPAEEALQRSLADGAERADELRQRFARWESDTLDLPGVYYAEVTDWIFRENRIAEGRFVALGRQIYLSRITLPLFLLVGREDGVVPAEQALATAQLLGTPSDDVQVAIEPSGHLGLLMGRTTMRHAWRRIADWVSSDLEASDRPPADRAA